ncbi:hypothetical protein N7522_002707 [Penicillium canescens]|nr:hypothetical protein N7522_002707 [Penicillium canescens]
MNATTCSLFFDVPETLGPPSHRRYVQSVHQEQLKGKAVPNATTPRWLTAHVNPAQLMMQPKGLLSLCSNCKLPVQRHYCHPQNVQGNGTPFCNMTKKGIDQNNAVQAYGLNYTYDNMPNFQEDEDFMVWMRPAGLPSFSKLSRRNGREAMPKAFHRLDIQDNMFPS